MSGGGLAGHRNSFNTSVRCGNWFEDSKGAWESGQIPARHAAARWEVPTHARDFTAPSGAPVKVAPPPNPLDALDGHLVMAHGTHILERTPESGHYMSVAAGAANGITPQEMLNVHAHPTIGVRTDLMRAKAHLRASGLESSDPSAVFNAAAFPGIAPTALIRTAAVELGRTAAARPVPVDRAVLTVNATLAAVAPLAPASGFSRNAAFSSTYKPSFRG